ncbi:MAG TPA: alanine racemase [Stackebrandtia sp.]|uniref:alanine racemase n=1 Tax=Stackebrandtia sp. TaxID=2023065 RepID=UPI002D72275C|nr:alanine racemase [Stackebrandtia sp.]HZE40425.1 alanine racemase [Stackebrandtia sp.]
MLDAVALRALDNERLDWRYKAIAPGARVVTVAEWLRARPRLSQLGTPVMTLDADALSHNIDAMARWCRDNGLGHAPHGKTSMAPQIWSRQLEAGAGAITVANAAQLAVARAFGVPRVIVANELPNPDVVRWAARGGEVTCFADSVATVSMMDQALRGDGTSIAVCVELGGRDGRAGVRDYDAARKVAATIRSAPGLRLVGVSGYEGALTHGTGPADLATVDGFLGQLRALFESLSFETDTPMLTVGGSQYVDQVAERLGFLGGCPSRTVLRAGSYVTHDDGLYARVTPAARGGAGPDLRAALRLHATVLSMPEPGLAILDAGRRDLPFDAGMPLPLDLPGATVTDLNDQHAFLRGDLTDLTVGTRVRLGISHPCTAFDKWSLIPVLDADDVVIDAIRTFF